VTAGASGGSPGYSYAWSLISTQAGDDPTVAQFCNAQGVCSTTQLGPNCSPQSTCTATIQGVKGGKATLQVTVTDSANNQTTAQTRLIVVQITQVNAVIVNNVGTGTVAQASSIAISPGALLWPAALWAGTAPLVLIPGSVSNIALSAQTIPIASDPDLAGALAFQAYRAPDDAAALGRPSDTPGLTSITSGYETLSLNQTGSFQVVAFVDSNFSGVRDNNEVGISVPLILVAASTSSNLSGAFFNIAYAKVTDATGAWTESKVNTGTFDIATPTEAAIHLSAPVTFVGGGADGSRGVGQVFGGWVQALTSAPNVVGTYQNGHQDSWVLANNIPASQYFLPGGVAPNVVPAPVLDTGRAAPAPGSGANSSTLRHSQPTSVTPLTLGSQVLIEAVDSPSGGFLANHAYYTASALTQITFNLSFCAYLTVWSNNSGTISPTGNPADRTIAVLMDVPWAINAVYNVDAFGNGTESGVPTTAIGAITIHVPTVPVTATGVVMAPPTALNLLADNAQNAQK